MDTNPALTIKTEKARNPVVDCAKGIAIVSVVVSHVLRGELKAGLISATLGFRITDAALYLFHVQLFLLVSGYLAFPRAVRPDVQRNRQISLAYAYLLWSAISLTLLFATDRVRPTTAFTESYVSLLYAPIQHFWFLPTIMIGYACLFLLRYPWSLLIAAATCILFRAAAGFSYYGLDYYLFFFFVGAWLRMQPGIPVQPGWPAIGCASLFAVGVILAVRSNLAPPTIIPMIPFSLAGCYAVYCAAQAIAARQTLAARWLEVAGKQSMPIYLAHVIFTSETRQIISCHVHASAPVLVTIGVLVGIGGPLMLENAAARTGLRRWFGFAPLVQ